MVAGITISNYYCNVYGVENDACFIAMEAGITKVITISKCCYITIDENDACFIALEAGNIIWFISSVDEKSPNQGRHALGGDLEDSVEIGWDIGHRAIIKCEGWVDRKWRIFLQRTESNTRPRVLC